MTMTGDGPYLEISRLGRAVGKERAKEGSLDEED